VRYTIDLIHAVVAIFRITLDLFKFFFNATIVHFIKEIEVTNNQSEENQQPNTQQEMLNNLDLGGNFTINGNVIQNIRSTSPVNSQFQLS
jgi:hypothetical protein